MSASNYLPEHYDGRPIGLIAGKGRYPELVAERLVRLGELVGPDRIVASTDCGFAQGPFARRVHPSIQWAKLGALAEGARLAEAELAR